MSTTFYVNLESVENIEKIKFDLFYITWYNDKYININNRRITLMKLKLGRVVVTILIVVLVLILIVSGAIEINLLKAWEWIAAGAQVLFGKIADFVQLQPKDFFVLAIGGVVGYPVSYTHLRAHET